MNGDEHLLGLLGIPLSPEYHQAVSSMKNGFLESLLGNVAPVEYTFGDNMGRENRTAKTVGSISGMTPYIALGALAASGLMNPYQYALPSPVYNAGLGVLASGGGLAAREVVTGGETPSSIARGTAFGGIAGPVAGRTGAFLDDLILAAYSGMSREGK